jgi:pilus assembly protein Flp/PilA
VKDPAEASVARLSRNGFRDNRATAGQMWVERHVEKLSLPTDKGNDMLHRLYARRVRPTELGATAVEYALMVMLIALVIIAAVTTLGSNLTSIFSGAASRV